MTNETKPFEGDPLDNPALGQVEPQAQVQTQEPPFDCVGAIMAYEQGELNTAGALELFAHLIRTGLAWSLQGCYGRTAASLINSGYITKDGEITPKGELAGLDN